MRIVQLDEERPGAGTLLIADEEAGTAVLIDPGEDISTCLLSAKVRGLRLTHVFATHVPDVERRERLQLWKKLGVPVHASSRLPRHLGFEPLMDGSSMRLGSLRLEFHHLGARSRDALGILLFEIRGSTARRAGVVTRDYRRVA